jgi:serine/alanine adding enzyme
MFCRRSAGALGTKKALGGGFDCRLGVVVCSENRRADWDDLIANCADATSGHLWQWREVVGSAYGFDSFYLLAQDGRDRPVAAAPFVFVRSFLYGSELSSMPYLDYGGVCHADWLDPAGRDAARAELIAHARELASKLRAKRLHIRSLYQLAAPFEVSTEKVAQHLALTSTVDEQLGRLPSERRNRLKRIDKLGLGVEVSDATEPAALADFCATYSENMRDLGSPTHGRRFFSRLASALRDRLSLIRVRNHGRVIAAGLAMNFRGAMTLPWSGATLEARPVYATNALYWKAIQLGIESGCHTFDFGRSTVGSGIFEFKRQWGPTPVQPYWSTLYLSPRAAAPRQRKSLQAISRLWRHMPLGIARTVGPGLRRGISN